jgi:citrate synthase
MTYDPAFMNTASCRSAITLIDGDKGILRYRGYPIEQLAESSTYLEVAYLLLNGELPNQVQLEKWTDEVTNHTYVHEFLREAMKGFRYDAHAMGKMVSMLGALSTFYPESKNVRDPKRPPRAHRQASSPRCRRSPPGPTATASAAPTSTRTTSSATPATSSTCCFAWLSRASSRTRCSSARPRRPLHPPRRPRAELLDQRRARGRLGRDRPLLDPRGGLAALYGPLHGGANEAVLRMLRQIGDVKNVPDFVKSVKDGKGRLMGFGHRVYKNYDPRAKVIKKLADDVFEVTGKNPLLEIAIELETIALNEDYFVKRKLYPNVDFYSGLIYQAMGFPVEMFPVCSPSPAPPAGWRSGRRCSSTRSRRSPVPRQIFLAPKPSHAS